MKKTEEEK